MRLGQGSNLQANLTWDFHWEATNRDLTWDFDMEAIYTYLTGDFDREAIVSPQVMRTYIYIMTRMWKLFDDDIEFEEILIC